MTNPLSEPIPLRNATSKHVDSKSPQKILRRREYSAFYETYSDHDDDEGFSSEDSSKSEILSRFLNRLMEPQKPVHYSKSLPSLVPNQADNFRFRSEALVTEGWILERCIEGTPGRKYNVSGLIVDSDTILATQIKSGRFGFTGGDDRVLDMDDYNDDSVSQNYEHQKNNTCLYFYLVLCILLIHFSWCIYRYLLRSVHV